MKVLHINTTDRQGGAAIAAYRLHKSMILNNIDSTYFVARKTVIDESTVKEISSLNKKKWLLSKFFNKIANKLFVDTSKGLFSSLIFGLSINEIEIDSYDVIYIHWINNNFLNYSMIEKILKKNKLVIWVCHDMFPITGGCHHSFGCNKYEYLCNDCFYIKRKIGIDYTKYLYKKKEKKISKYNNLKYVCPSVWLTNCASMSGLLNKENVYNIKNIIDPKIFYKKDCNEVRKILNSRIASEYKVILFGADAALINPYKGFSYFVESLNILFNKDKEINNNDIKVLIYGSDENEDITKKIPYETIYLGRISDEMIMNDIYNSADVFCIPSLAENFSNAILESMATETPVVGFNVGGIPDMVNKNTGYLAEYKNSMDFANGILYCLNEKNQFNFNIIQTCYDSIVLPQHYKIWDEKR